MGPEVKSSKVVADRHIPRAIQLAMTIPSSSSTSPSKTIGELQVDGDGQVDRLLLWIKLLLMPSAFIAPAVVWTFKILRDMAAGDVSTGPWWLVVTILLHVYPAAVQAASGHLGLFSPEVPYAAWDALNQVGFREIVFPVFLTSAAALMLNMTWLLVTWACLLGLLVAGTIAFWLCLLRTYSGSYQSLGLERGSCDDVIDGLAYLYSWILYEYAFRFPGDRSSSLEML